MKATFSSPFLKPFISLQSLPNALRSCEKNPFILKSKRGRLSDNFTTFVCKISVEIPALIYFYVCLSIQIILLKKKVQNISLGILFIQTRLGYSE